jgi:CRP-like cAMP-binding protein
MPQADRGVSCWDCPLRQNSAFSPISRAELDFIGGARRLQLDFDARQHILTPGEASDVFFTLFEGWAFKYQALEDGRRQIIDFLLPGDVLGLHSPFNGVARHGVCTVTKVRVCPLSSEGFSGVVSGQAGLTRGLLQTLLIDDRRADRRLLLIGQQTASERVCFLLLELRDRLRARGMASSTECEMPLTYEQIADALGLGRSPVARSLADLRTWGWATVQGRRAVFTDPAAMQKHCGYQPPPDERRMLI